MILSIYGVFFELFLSVSAAKSGFFVFFKIWAIFGDFSFPVAELRTFPCTRIPVPGEKYIPSNFLK